MEYRTAVDRIRDDIAGGAYGNQFDSVAWDADHVISLNRLVQTPGFTSLSPADQLAIAHSPENLKPLRRGWNRSKQADSVYDWQGPRSGPSPTPTEAERVELCQSEAKATSYILDQISLRSSPPEREDSADSGVSNPPTAPPTDPPALTDTVTATVEEIPYPQQAAPASPEWTPERTASIDTTTPAWTEPSQLPAQPSPEIAPPTVTSSIRPPVEAPRVTSNTNSPRSSAPSRPSTATEDDDSFWEKAAPYAAGAGLIALGIAVAPAAPVLGAGAVIGGIAAGATG
ncbi:MAG: hypothetical protein WBG53_01915 [Rhodococcus sp. (in: high G+C Gram-positive bacteria)]|uniref:hypothetical protein n=1 Tax=Rhodococcus sp. SBT000017 TaxID=1803385 RepID=UPI000EF90435|nr:hypothetical protein [Rhodococcus sp. SBT000017]RMB78102.1 hypothetical protein AYK61_18280 [Rhodococcus sp. SBT000017]